MIGSDRIRTEALDSCFDAFSSREPVSTSLENALRSGDRGIALSASSDLRIWFGHRRFDASGQLSRGKGMADAGNHAVPLALLGGGIIDQYAVEEPAGEIAAVIPDQIVAETRDNKKIRSHALVHDVGWRVLLCQIGGRRIMVDIFSFLHGECC